MESMVGSKLIKGEKVFQFGAGVHHDQIEMAVRVAQVYDRFCDLIASGQQVVGTPAHQKEVSSKAALQALLKNFMGHPGSPGESGLRRSLAVLTPLNRGGPAGHSTYVSAPVSLRARSGWLNRYNPH